MKAWDGSAGRIAPLFDAGWAPAGAFVRAHCRRLNVAELIGPLRCEAAHVQEWLTRGVRPIPLPLDGEDDTATRRLEDWAEEEALMHLPVGWAKMTAEERIQAVGTIPQPARNGPGAGKPSWDRRGRKLRIAGVVIRDFKKKRARNQEAILDAFEGDGWAPAVDLSQPSGKALSDAVHQLNATMSPPLIHFRMSGTGSTVEWDLRQGPREDSSITGR